MANIAKLVPCYGRDYKSKEAVLEDWEAGKDFILMNFDDKFWGKPLNINDVRGSDQYNAVEIRYAKLRKTTGPIKC